AGSLVGMRHRSALRPLAAVLAVSTLVLTGCSSALVVEAAEDAANPDCALPILLMPDQIGDLEQRTTSSQGTTAWGEPASVIVRCGVPEPAPTTDPCVTVDGVDGAQGRADEDTWRVVTYGCSPAVEVLVTPTVVCGANALASVASSVSEIEQTAQCVDAQAAEQVEGEVPAG